MQKRLKFQLQVLEVRKIFSILRIQDSPINLVGIVLATLAKALVANEKYPDKRIVKVAGCEVRYNSQLFLDAITRIQAAQGIETLVPVGKKQFLSGWHHF